MVNTQGEPAARDPFGGPDGYDERSVHYHPDGTEHPAGWCPDDACGVLSSHIEAIEMDYQFLGESDHDEAACRACSAYREMCR